MYIYFCCFFTNPDVQVKVTESITHQGFSRAKLKCHSSCRLPDSFSYIWYKSEQKIQEETASYSGPVHPADSYSCAVRGHEDFPPYSICEFTSQSNKQNSNWWNI